MSLAPTQFLKLGDLTKDATLACIDGRHKDCVVGAPGGNMGEFIMLITALERATTRLLRRAEIQQIFSDYVSHFGRFYMHTDHHALAWIAGELDHDTLNTEEIIGFKEKDRQLALDLLTTPNGVGCGHIKGMLLSPSRYDVRRKLVEDALAAYFETLWEHQDAADLEFESLAGEHQETEVIIFEADDEDRLHDETQIPMVCKHETVSRFVLHDAARRYLLVKAKDFIAEHQELTPEEDRRFRDEVNRLVPLQLEATRNALFPDLPTRIVRIG